MRTSTKKISLAVVSAAALGGLALLTPTIAQAASGGSSSSVAPHRGGDRGVGHSGPGQGETALTGDAATKVTAAAQAAVPGGTVVRVETDRDGSYEAHVTKTDGTHVEVKVDTSFTVTAVQTRPGGGPGHGMGPGRGETALTGDAATKVTAAAQVAVPGGTVVRVETDRDGSYEAHVTKPDGTHVEVKVDTSFTVTAVQTRPGGDHGGPGHAA